MRSRSSGDDWPENFFFKQIGRPASQTAKCLSQSAQKQFQELLILSHFQELASSGQFGLEKPTKVN